MPASVASPNGWSEHPVASPTDPRIVVLIDDYDVLAASGTAPLASLLPYLTAAGDSGLHAVMTRRVMGASRPGVPVQHVQTVYVTRSEARQP